MDFALQWVRRRQRALTRAVLALFCLAWLQAAALPCVMAHTSMPDAGSTAQHCPYCPSDDATSTSGSQQGACAFPHQPQADGRSAAVLFVALPMTAILPVIDEAGLSVRGAISGPTDPVPRVPLSVSYCRFIE